MSFHTFISANAKYNISIKINNSGFENMRVKGGTNVLDEVDWKILEALLENARETYSEIGRRLNISHSTVYERVKSMEQCGIIKGYRAVVDLKEAGRRGVTAIMTVFTDPKESENVARSLSEFREISEVFASLSEELSLIAKATAKNQEELHSFIAHSIAPLPGVLRIKTSVITRKYKEDSPFSSEAKFIRS